MRTADRGYNPIHYLFWPWLVSLLIFPSSTFAAEDSAAPTLAETTIKTADTTREYVSQKFVGYISEIDHFFGSDRNFQENNKSVLQLNLNELLQKDGYRQTQMAIKAKIELPSTQQRLHLLLESNPENNTAANDSTNQSNPINQSTSPVNYGVAVRFEKPEDQGLRFSSDLGIKVQAPLQPFARTRVSFSTPLDSWRMKVAQSLFWFSQPGLGETSQLDFEHALGDPALFRATSTITWMHQLQHFDVRQDFSVYHTLDERRATVYQVSAIGTSSPEWQSTDYVFSFRYRQRLNRKWLFFEINPQLHFPVIDSYRLAPLLLLKFEMLFDAISDNPSNNLAPEKKN